MDSKARPNSPREFLASLQGGPGGVATAHAAAPSLAEAQNLSFDFSDLATPRAPAKDPANPTEQKSGTATASPVDTSKPAAPAAVHSGSSSTPATPLGTSTEPTRDSATAPRGEYLNALFERVNALLGPQQESTEEQFMPHEPTTLEETGLTSEDLERIILKYLLNRGSASGRKLAQQVAMPFNIIEPLLRTLKTAQLVAFKGAATMGDYEYILTDLGRERARRYSEECTYFGTAPVALKDYLPAMAAQSIAKQHATKADLEEAFSELIISKDMLDRLGPAINSGRGMFLFGEPGNGKTSIAERVTNCFGSTLWIPRALGIDGDIIRLYDPAVHELVDESPTEGLFNLSGVDQRWINIRRPTVVAGGELTMAELEVKQNLATKICEAPLQLKSNCGTLVIDDFGRQRMPVAELLNRWIVPLEKRYDFLNLPSGKKIQVPFDQIIIFSTNLEPRDLVDGAFLRRIPYKIKVPDPTEEQFHQLFQVMAPHLGFQYHQEAVEYLLATHYRPKNRPLRACQPRDLLLQVRNFCLYHTLPKTMTPAAFDFAVDNYFSVM